MFKLDSAGPFGQVALTTTIGTVYTVPSGKILQVTSVVIINTGSQAEDFELWITSQTNQRIWVPRTSMQANTRVIRREKFTIAASQSILGITFLDGAYTKVKITVHGVLLVN